jgi:hypothetical protein
MTLHIAEIKMSNKTRIKIVNKTGAAPNCTA